MSPPGSSPLLLAISAIVFGIAFLDKSVYYISELPSELLWRDVGVIEIGRAHV